MIQSPEATELAKRVCREAERRAMPGGELKVLQSMVRRWRRDGFKGTIDQWEALARLVEP